MNSKIKMRLALLIALGSIVPLVFGFSPNFLSNKRKLSFTLGVDKGNKIPEDAVPLDSPEVKYVLSELMKTLEKNAGMKSSTASSTSSVEPSIDTDNMLQDVDASFAKLLSDIKTSTKLTETQKRFLTAETALTMSDAKEGDTNAMDSASATTGTSGGRIGLNEVKTLAYSQAAAPYLIVHGPGSIGTALKAFMKSLGSVAEVKYIDASALGIVSDAEIDYAVRQSRSIIIAADDMNSVEGKDSNSKKKGDGGGLLGVLGLGGNDANKSDIPKFVINEKSLKRLLNAVVRSRNKNGHNVKVVALAAASKESRGIASLIGGDTFDLENEVILQCQKRQLDYCVMKVGGIVDLDLDKDKETFESNERLRPLRVDMERAENNIPFVFTRSRVQPGEVTDQSVAVEALLRAASHYHTNASISVITIDNVGRRAYDGEWDDEFQKLEGPELLRIPLKYATELQMSIKVGRIASELQQPGTGLVTPIEVQKYTNGVKILFRPKESPYLSSKEEKEKEKQGEEEKRVMEAKEKNNSRMGKYQPPEALVDPKEGNNSNPSSRTNVPEKLKSKKKQRPEGGLEIIVDGTPYRRVRIRRCNMGPNPVVKEESEALILKALQQGIRNLEAFYEKMLEEGYEM